VVVAAAETELWSLTDRQLAVEVADAVALRAQADAVLLVRLGEAGVKLPMDLSWIVLPGVTIRTLRITCAAS